MSRRIVISLLRLVRLAYRSGTAWTGLAAGRGATPDPKKPRGEARAFRRAGCEPAIKSIQGQAAWFEGSAWRRRRIIRVFVA